MKTDPEDAFRKALKPLPWQVDSKGTAWKEPIRSRKSQLDDYEHNRPARGPSDMEMEKRLEVRNQRRLRYHIQRGARLPE